MGAVWGLLDLEEFDLLWLLAGSRLHLSLLLQMVHRGVCVDSLQPCVSQRRVFSAHVYSLHGIRCLKQSQKDIDYPSYDKFIGFGWETAHPKFIPINSSFLLGKSVFRPGLMFLEV